MSSSTSSCPEMPRKKVRTTSSSSLERSAQKGTIYITVGPQCSGKTTILKRIFGASFHKNEDASTNTTGGVDITIDDQALVYIPIPVCYFLQENITSSAVEGGINLQTDVLGKSIQERINDVSNDELRYVVRRMGGQLSSGDFATLLRGNKTQTESINSVEDLINAVECLVLSNVSLPEEVDLFIVESIFRPRPFNLMLDITGDASTRPTSALDAALDLLSSHANNSQVHLPTEPMAWGNTNTRPREYTSALEAAAKSGRPVEFIVFGGSEACDMIRDHLSRREYRKMHEDGTIDEHPIKDQLQILCLPKISRLELFKRNLHRFSETGRYIPSVAINDAMIRVESLLASAAADAKKTCDPNSTMTLNDAKFRLDYELVKLAGFELNPDRTVNVISQQQSTRNSGRGTHSNFYQNAQSNGGRFERGTNRNDNPRGRWGGGRRPYNQTNYQAERRENRQGRGANHHEGRGRNQRGGTRGYQEYGGRFNDQGWNENKRYNSNQGRGRSYNSFTYRSESNW